MAETISKVVYGSKVLIDLTSDTVTADKLLEGIVAHDKSGTKITGSCTFDADTGDATATVAEILSGKTAYVNGSKLTGTMTNNGGVTGEITDADTPYSIPSGYHDGSGTVNIAATEKVDRLMYETDMTGPCAIIMGSEDKGISSSMLELADDRAAIPMAGQISSLNVSVAASVMIYECVRQRLRK